MARVIITGTSKGIGRFTALEAIKRGHEVVATARNPASLDDIDGLAARLRLDVTDPASIETALAAAGDVDALVSNAGDTTNGPVETTPIAEFRRLFELNTIGALQVAQPLVARFRAMGRGRVIFVSSVVGQVSIPLKSPYAASKWALEAIAEALARETEPFGLHVSLIEPGPVSGTTGRATAREFFAENDPYLPRPGADHRSQSLDAASVPVEEVAAAIVDTLEAEEPPLHVPVGRFAIEAIARKYAAAR
ncbi:MAG TPA: SDR family NAD(P)-dependent oxidoreductase [Pseudonocardia sp.]|nr:SDR family NAD(P)-dependent oxidoreductase [Pseudonocardia sp.]